MLLILTRARIHEISEVGNIRSENREKTGTKEMTRQKTWGIPALSAGASETGNHPVLKAEFRWIQSKDEYLVKTLSFWHIALQAKAVVALLRKWLSIACNYLNVNCAPFKALYTKAINASPHSHAAQHLFSPWAVLLQRLFGWEGLLLHASLGPQSRPATASAMRKNTAQGYSARVFPLFFVTAPCTVREVLGISIMG